MEGATRGHADQSRTLNSDYGRGGTATPSFSKFLSISVERNALMRTFPRGLMAALGLTILLLLAGGAWYYRTQRQHIQREVEAELGAISQLKVDQIVSWRATQLDEAAEVTRNLFFVEGVSRWMTGQQASIAEEIVARFRAMQEHYHYRDVLLLDTRGKVRLSLSGHLAQLCEETRLALAVALSERRPALTDLHAGDDDQAPHLAAVAPLFGESKEAHEPIGAVVLQNDARYFLYPLIRSWPIPSRSAETLLVRRDGGAALFLNDLRYQKDAALKLRIPLARTEVPAVAAVLGRAGVMHGKDYRGVDVLSVLKAIPGSPWFLVTKVDREEAFSEWHREAVMIMALILGLAAATVAMVGVVWQRNDKAHYRALLQAEMARKESEERYQTTLMSVGDGVIATDSEGRVTVLNPVAEALTGWRHEEANGKPIEEVFRIINEESRQPVEDPVLRVVRDGLVVGLANHTTLISRDGMERPIADSGAPILDEDGAVRGVVLVFSDQSKERETRRRLQAEKERAQRYLDVAGVMILVLDTDGNVVLVNNKGCEILACGEQDILGKNWFEHFIPEKDRDQTRAVFATIVAGELEMHEYVKNPIVTRGGEERLIAWHNALVRDESAAIIGTISSGEDITERERAEAERAMLASAIEQAGEAVVIIAPGGIIEFVNPAFERISGYSREDVIGRDSRILKIDEQDQDFYRGIWETLSSGKTWEGRLVNRRKDGSRYTQDTTISPVRNSEGVIVNYVAVNRDVTEHLRLSEEKARLGEQLLQAQKMESVGRLAGGVAHDFNNMLQAILGNAEMALDEASPGSSLRESLLEIQKAARRSADLTRQLLAFARRQTVAPRVLDLNDTISGILKMLQRLIGEDIHLSWMPGHDLWQVSIDPSQIDQILANLTVNARDAIDGVGRVTIGTANVVLDETYCAGHSGFVPGRYVMLAVSDDGCGMSKETMDRIFEPFFTSKGVGQGTGLGLSTVYGIVKQNEGSVNVYSEVGRGTTFRIYLPAVAAEPVASAAAPEEQAPEGGAETVLMVEDEEAILKQGRRILERLGYTVLTAGTPGEAIELAQNHSGAIHLLLSDVVMPQMNGRELAQRLTTMKPGLKCLYMSGYTADVIAHHGVLEEGVHFMQKPFSFNEMAQKIREALA